MFEKVILFLLLLNCKSVSSKTVRLVSPLNNGVGRVEIFHNGEWGTVCDDSFTDLAAKVVCRQLGRYEDGFQPKAITTFGFGSGKIWLDNVNCIGNERLLSNCSHRGWGIHNCNHNEDVGVICDERSVTMKLAPGYKSGLLQVYHSNSWGTVCDDIFCKVEATVVCRALGYQSGDVTNKNSTIRMWLDDVDCSMNNTDLKDCKHRDWGRDNCSPVEAVGVDCYSFSSGHTAARLVSPTNTPGEGRLELYYEGQWGTVCTRELGTEVANVVCRMLGFNGGGKRLTSGYSFGFGPVLLQDVNCKGTETNISDCSHSKWGANCSHTYDLGVRCYSAADIQQGIRLVSSIHGAGRVEVLHNNVWGTVCRIGFTMKEAQVVCRMANLPWSGAHVSTLFGKGSDVIWLSSVNCAGNETNLDQCSHSMWGTSTCSHDSDVGVVCSEARLVSGGSVTRGRLEIFYNNMWGTVCDIGFTNISAKVACRMVGQPDKHAYFTLGGSYGRGSGRVWLSNVQCMGSETTLGECNHSSWGTTCSHSQDVGVVCSYSPKIHLEPDTDTININMGNELVVHCIVDDANPPVTSITWSHSGRSYTGKIFQLRNISKTDRGTLTCTASNGLGLTPARAVTFINVLYQPKVYILPRLDVIKGTIGNNLTVQCVADPPTASIMWSHKGQYSSGSTFHIQNVTQSDEGRLTCTAHNGAGTQPGLKDTFIKVVEKSIVATKIHLEPNLDMIKIHDGANLTVNCLSNDDNTAPSFITWSHNGRVIPGSLFIIHNVTQSDEGRLTCTAHNGVGTSPGREDTFIQVLGKVTGAGLTSDDVTSDSTAWSMMHTVVVVTGAIAALVIVVLVVVVIIQCRKLGATSVKREERKEVDKKLAASNPVYNEQDEEEIYENARNSNENGRTTAETKKQNRESAHYYESSALGDTSEDPDYVNMATTNPTVPQKRRH